MQRNRELQRNIERGEEKRERMGKRKRKMERRVSVAVVISTERTDRKIKIDFACLNCTHRDFYDV